MSVWYCVNPACHNSLICQGYELMFCSQKNTWTPEQICSCQKENEYEGTLSAFPSLWTISDEGFQHLGSSKK